MREADWEERNRMKAQGYKTIEEELDSIEYFRKVFVETLHKFIITHHPQVCNESRAIDVDINVFVHSASFEVDLEALAGESEWFENEVCRFLSIETPIETLEHPDGRVTVTPDSLERNLQIKSA